mmetsp:Transcript_900/g.1857  ORF Transcript_900/g.1857 Transcript_900/m.1857 type:complete len:363 (+) Transcript_900:320-1408(+)
MDEIGTLAAATCSHRHAVLAREPLDGVLQAGDDVLDGPPQQNLVQHGDHPALRVQALLHVGEHHRRHNHRADGALDAKAVVAHAAHGGVEALAEGVPLVGLLRLVERRDERDDVRAEALVQLRRKVHAEVDHRLRHRHPVELAHRVEELHHVAAVGVGEGGGHAGVHQHHLRNLLLELLRERQPRVHVLPERLPHRQREWGEVPHQDVARVQVRVHEVVHEHHLEHHREPQLGQDAVHHAPVLLVAGVLGEPHALLERLHQRRRVRDDGLGEGHVVPLAEVVVEVRQPVALHREVHLSAQQSLELPRHLVQVEPLQRRNEVHRRRQQLHHREVVPDGLLHPRVANLQRDDHVRRRRLLPLGG